MKRLATQPITAFFQRKQTRRISIESIGSSNCSDNDAPDDSVEAIEDQEQTQKQLTVKRIATSHREDLMGLLQYRELVGCATTRQFISGIQTFRRRRKQQLVRWTLTHFQKLPMGLQLPPNWNRQAGFMCTEPFYASCMEFDAGGVLLVAGASNGVIALYDFDDVFHRSLNLGHRLQNSEVKDDEEGDGEQQEQKMTEEILHPIHMIFTSFEVKCIRWNPLNEDEIACSFTNRNEIHIYNLGKFPSKPHIVLKCSIYPSSGYNDLLYLTVTEKTMPRNRQSKVVHVIAGDMEGAIHVWDLRFPLRPLYSFLTIAASTPITSLLLSSNKQFLICGSKYGTLMTYDIQHKIVPLFGSKPVPQYKAVVDIMEAIKPYLSPALLETVLLTRGYGSSDIMSLRLVPESETQVLCQLRNDWVVVIDYLLGTVMKLHTFLRELKPRDKPKTAISPSVLSMASESEYQRDFSRRNAWLSCHRCTGTVLFDKSIMCTGIYDTTSLTMIDLHQLRRIKATATDENSDADMSGTATSGISEVPAVDRLDRFRIPMNGIITAVAAHPNQHLIICGGENMNLQIMGVMGN